MSGRIGYIAAAVVVIGIGSIGYGFHHRVEKKNEQTKAAVSSVSASDAATSTRQTVPQPSAIPGTPLTSVGGVPIQPGTNMPGAAPGVVTAPLSTVTQPLAEAGKTLLHPFPPAGQNQQQYAAPISYYQPPTYQQVPATNPVEIDPVEKARMERQAYEYKRRMDAIDAPVSGTPKVFANATPDPLQAAFPRMPAFGQNVVQPQLGSPIPPAATALRGIEDEDPNGQGGKRAFQQTEGGDYLKTTRLPPPSRWVLQPPDVIPAGLPHAVVSDLPGDVVAEVKTDVYDSPTHKFILIPAGSLLAGRYNSSVTYGQGRVQVVWTYLRFPDGSYVDLDKFPGQSADGSTGFKDKTDNHLKRLIGGVALSSLFAASIEIATGHSGSNSTLSYPSTGQLAGVAAGQQAAQVGQQLTNRNLNIQPTIKIRPGDVIAVYVSKTIVFPGPYEPMNGGGSR
jgi:type IV secretion system protein VirB10